MDGNFGGTPNFVGNQSYASSYFVLGDYGVDTSNHTVWAVLDHNSEFAVIPEPSTLSLLAAGAVGLLGYSWRRRVARKIAKPTAFDKLGPQDDVPAILAFPSCTSYQHDLARRSLISALPCLAMVRDPSDNGVSGGVYGRNKNHGPKGLSMSISSRSLDTSGSVPEISIPSAMWAEIFAEVARLGLGEHFPLAVQLTRSLFGEDFEISVEQDPEIGNWFDVVFTVHTGGTMEEVLEKYTLWHRRLPHATTDAGGAFCLSIDARS